MSVADSLAIGLLDTSAEIQNPLLAEKLRSFTISWTRYDYYGPIFEATRVEEIAAAAKADGYRYCLVQAYGHVVVEPWARPDSNSKRFYEALEDLIADNSFSLAGQFASQAGSDSRPRCLLIDLQAWPESGLLTNAECRDFPSEMTRRTYFLGAARPQSRDGFARYLDGAASDFEPENSDDLLTEDQQRFLGIVKGHTQGAQRGVFLWNVESYRDVAAPQEFGFAGPVGTLSCVAAGFKPNMILKTHGFDSNTRVVYFDYSAAALEFRRLLKDEWDGDDFPHFLQYAFRKLPSPETFYHLWNDKRPEELTASDFEDAWQFELERWGGAAAFKEEWGRYRRLAHEFVHCNLLIQPERLFARMGTGSSDVVWWSNAFFTVFSNWHYTLPERRAIYDAWVRGLADRNPDVVLYGFDYNNVGVNAIRAAEHAERYFRAGRDYLRPDRPYRIQIRC